MLGLVGDLPAEILPGQPEAAKMGNLGKTNDMTVKIA
jgi:hypothetical protein